MKTPKPYCIEPKNIRAFVLGCDPTGFGKHYDQIEFETVFGIGKDARYFAGIEPNLKLLGLNKGQIYVQNMVTEYQDEGSSKTKNWISNAEKFIGPRLAEFDLVYPLRITPVFLTSKLLYKALLNRLEKPYSAKELYNLPMIIPIPATTNSLFLPLSLCIDTLHIR